MCESLLLQLRLEIASRIKFEIDLHRKNRDNVSVYSRLQRRTLMIAPDPRIKRHAATR